MQFAQVEQQIKQNEQLETLISIEKSAQATTALAYVGATVAIDGQTAALKNGQATWTFNVPKPVTATVTIKSATGQTVYTGSFSMNAGTQSFQWDGRDANGVQWPDGNYTISVTGKDASGQTVAIPSEIEGVVDSVDLTKTPPELTVGGQTFTLDKIKRVVRPTDADLSCRRRFSASRRLRRAAAALRGRPCTSRIACSSAGSSNGLRRIGNRVSPAAATSL